eukprot:m.76967 g.76967  ORF g.76967 m.76967 type:complete len:403 (-) comp12593_c1_seq2:68-1276(-)
MRTLCDFRLCILVLVATTTAQIPPNVGCSSKLDECGCSDCDGYFSTPYQHYLGNPGLKCTIMSGVCKYYNQGRWETCRMRTNVDLSNKCSLSRPTSTSTQTTTTKTRTTKTTTTKTYTMTTTETLTTSSKTDTTKTLTDSTRTLTGTETTKTQTMVSGTTISMSSTVTQTTVTQTDTSISSRTTTTATTITQSTTRIHSSVTSTTSFVTTAQKNPSDVIADLPVSTTTATATATATATTKITKTTSSSTPALCSISDADYCKGVPIELCSDPSFIQDAGRRDCPNHCGLCVPLKAEDSNNSAFPIVTVISITVGVCFLCTVLVVFVVLKRRQSEPKQYEDLGNQADNKKAPERAVLNGGYEMTNVDNNTSIYHEYEEPTRNVSHTYAEAKEEENNSQPEVYC